MSELRGRRSGDDPSDENRPADPVRPSGDTNLREPQAPTPGDSAEQRPDHEAGRPPDEPGTVDLKPQTLTARQKLEQRLDQIYWPGYSKWSANDSTDQHPTADTPATPTTNPSEAAAERQGSRASEHPHATNESPQQGGHLLQDDTVARLHYLNGPDEASGSQRPTTPDPDTSRDEVLPSDTSRSAKPPGDATPTDDSDELPAQPADEPTAHPVDLSRTDSPLTKPDNTAAPRGASADDLPTRSTDVADDPDSEPRLTAHADDWAGTDHEFVDDSSPAEMDQYRRIREAEDLDALAEHSGMPREVIEEAKQHLFQRQHDVAVGPGDIRHGYFTPFEEFGNLWERVASGIGLTDEHRTQFWSLLAHEYVESKLMESGLPYLSAEPDAWDEDGGPRVRADYASAHIVAPLSTRTTRVDLLRLWESTLEIPRGDLRVADDLSNLDEVVRVAKEGLDL